MRIGMWVVAVCLSLLWVSRGTAKEDARQPTNISAQELAPALQTLTRQRGIQLVYRSELLADHWTGGVSGHLTLDEALVQLLDATGLTYRYLADKAITIVPLARGDDAPPATEKRTAICAKGYSR